MKTPTDFELDQLMHLYDPQKAHEYYLRTRDLKGRQKASPQLPDQQRTATKVSSDPRAGKTRKQIHQSARDKQRKELTAAIQGLESRLHKLEALIKTRIHEEASVNRKAKAKNERAAKEKDKPKTAAEKAKINRENKKYRDKNQQKLRTAAKTRSSGSSGGSSSSTDNSGSAPKKSVSELHALANKVRGQIAVAKHKLAAL